MMSSAAARRLHQQSAAASTDLHTLARYPGPWYMFSDSSPWSFHLSFPPSAYMWSFLLLLMFYTLMNTGATMNIEAMTKNGNDEK